MEALRIIQEEHQSLAAILHAVRFMLKEIKAGRLTPDFGLFKAMVHYLDAYPEKRHHPKEDDFLFARLKQRTDEGAEALARLEHDHTGGEGRIKALEAALLRYEGGEPDGLEITARAFDDFAEFYRNHMILEEREILPLARKHLTQEDWDAIDEAFRTEQDPMKGAAGEDFRAIFSRLVAAAPPPIGLGSGPYKG
ncbi:MAG: hemerythrin domain-containing protein [Rhodocyclaceae bacterium]|nr:hemerythrin domain-containing protein [Rhodocyclaceae bacterium]MCP5310752.1 hemerythrin domain-containing protein [Zoogloeaceae bacterium]MCP5466038.1 hemerythrin domain-containing protein [Nevskiaceae bacterium]